MGNIFGQLESLRDNVRADNSDDTRLALVGLYRLYKGIDFNDWIDVLDRNNNYKIQNSGAFCEEIENAVKNGANPQYRKYENYINRLGVEYFAPKWIGGITNALKLEINSVILDLQAKRPSKKSVDATLRKMYRYYKQTGKVYRPAVKAEKEPHHLAPKGYDKLHALGLEDQMNTNIRRITSHIKRPSHINDVQEVIDFFLNGRLNKSNLAYVWEAVQTSITNLRDDKHSDLIQFARNGNLADNNGAYSVVGEDAKKNYTVTDFRNDLKHTGKDFQKIADWFVSSNKKRQQFNNMSHDQQVTAEGFKDDNDKNINNKIGKVEDKYPKLRAKTGWCPMNFYSVVTSYPMPIVKELADKIPEDPIIGSKQDYEWDKIVKGHKLTEKQKQNRVEKATTTDFSKIHVGKAPDKVEQLSLI